MRNPVPFVPVALLTAVLAIAALSPASLSAGEEGDLEKMISSAKTAADHEAIVAVYEKQAEEAAAEAAEHAKMEETYRASGGALVAKQHIDAHCRALAGLYKKIEKENKALAKAHAAMAKSSK